MANFPLVDLAWIGALCVCVFDEEEEEDEVEMEGEEEEEGRKEECYE